MMDRIPLTEKKGYELEIKNQNSRITVRKLSVIGNVYQKSISTDELNYLYEALREVDPEERPLFISE